MSAILKEFFTSSEAKTGAICAASSALASGMIQKAHVAVRENVIELGPGTGVITKYILDAMSDNSSLTCFELSNVLAERLEQEIQGHKNFTHTTIIEASALDVKKYVEDESCDCVISSLPWGLFKKDMQVEILEQIRGVLKKDGVFLTYAYWGIEKLPKGRSLTKQLTEMFSIESRSVVWRNVPPAVIYCVRK